MAKRFTAILLVSTLVTAGVLAFNSYRPAPASVDETKAPAQVVRTAFAADPVVPASAGYSAAEVEDFKAGFADGFSAGVMALSYPAENEMARTSRAYLDGYSQGYTDGQNQQGSLRADLCDRASAAALTAAPAVYSGSRYRSSRVATTRSLGERYVNDDSYERREVDRGIGSTARKALLIAGGAAAGAGIGGAVGGKKGALIGALAGGGTGTALAYTKKPSRAFNRRVSGKSVAVKTAIGAGAGAAIGALAGGKRGALAGLALGGGGGALWGLFSGKKNRR